MVFKMRVNSTIPTPVQGSQVTIHSTIWPRKFRLSAISVVNSAIGLSSNALIIVFAS